ncbi:uncharacterized protein PV07_06616 [Cladophialophora immunda]|uniref:Pentacotripeptide-repeat region of PRORP domain-containing protein n=1 Tax=Cladophialophora immunda TaxID=569365 RepID=A0A0D2ANZ5_9EURO|nr:uncharacterized protein PV07_06616 [Cladophialophora immunda]KIW26812.1 hypothetical protein PV07_06616 [Cladophialophora immunda]
MHQSSKILGRSSFPNATSIARYNFLICDFLAPTIRSRAAAASKQSICGQSRATFEWDSVRAVESAFYSWLSRAGECSTNRRQLQHSASTLRRTNRLKHGDGQEKGKSMFRGQCRSISHGVSQSGLTSLDRPGQSTRPRNRRKSRHNAWEFFDSNTLEFAQNSRLPAAFFYDLGTLHKKVRLGKDEQDQQDERELSQPALEEQMALLKSVRDLEEKLAEAKASLDISIHKKSPTSERAMAVTPVASKQPAIVLSKDDYKNLVDLYFFTHSDRFDPESPHSSPTPKFLEDYVFQLSEDFAPPQAYAEFYADDEGYESPLKEVEKMLKSKQLREVSAFKAFVDLLLDNHSSNAALFRAYKRLPQPGVGFLPKGTVRIFLQRMSTPWQKSEKSMIRYLSLIDDMQKANLPIARSEWASAIYLAGRSFSKVTESELNAALRLWRQMEQEAGVQAHNVTFNILFDIAVRANKYPLAQMILKEMHDRGLHLNRLGRVSVIYYHGLRGDGDAVRKAYRDFVDAGEIVDTLVLNCVMAALFNAQEPAAAEQIYERMKSLHMNTRREVRSDGTIASYRQYPGPGPELIHRKLAANSLRRVLLFASRLKHLLPEHHKEAQEMMPLRPDHTTFRTMISYHANVSGNLNRITVLINEMSELFGLSLQSIHYQLLFKGFALHGATRNPHATWNLHRLNLAWEACRKDIREGQMARRRARQTKSDHHTLPSIDVINETSEEREPSVYGGQTAFERMSEWDDFVLDLAAFPRERRKHIERIHAELFDEEREKREPLIRNPFSRSMKESPPHDQKTYYPLGERKLDQEEGEYVLPSPILAIDPSSSKLHDTVTPEETLEESVYVDPEPRTFPPTTDAYLPDPEPRSAARSSTDDTSSSSSFAEAETDSHSEEPDAEDGRDVPPLPSTSRYQVEATRPLICWLLRAYANATGSRQQVEAIWDSVRPLWLSREPNDQAAVIRVLRRCLRNCDRYGPPL